MMRYLIGAVLLIVVVVVAQEPGPEIGPEPRVLSKDAEVRLAVNNGLKTPGVPVEVDDGAWAKVYPSHDKAVQVPSYFAGGSMYRVAFIIDDRAPLVAGAETMDGVRVIIVAVAKANASKKVLVCISEPAGAFRWLNADGTPCKDQDSGPQYRACECRIVVGSITLP
jgi:hypothetical protein